MSLTPPAKGRLPSWRALCVLVAIWVAALFGAFWLARSVDWSMVRSALAAANPVWVFTAFAVNLIGLPIWMLAWRLLIPTRGRPGWVALFEAQSITLAAIQTFSVLGGGAVAIYMLTRRAGMTFAGVASLLAFDQLLTGVVKLILIGGAVYVAPAPDVLRKAGLSLLVVVAAMLIVLLVMARSEAAARRRADGADGWGGRLLMLGAEIGGNLAAIREPGKFGLACLFYLLRRSMEGVAAICLQRALGLQPSFDAALLVVAALSVSTIIPGPPGNLGVYEAVVSLAYVACGVAPETALALALLQHACYLAAAVAPGYATFALRRPWKDARLSP